MLGHGGRGKPVEGRGRARQARKVFVVDEGSSNLLKGELATPVCVQPPEDGGVLWIELARVWLVAQPSSGERHGVNFAIPCPINGVCVVWLLCRLAWRCESVLVFKLRQWV